MSTLDDLGAENGQEVVTVLDSIRYVYSHINVDKVGQIPHHCPPLFILFFLYPKSLLFCTSHTSGYWSCPNQHQDTDQTIDAPVAIRARKLTPAGLKPQGSPHPDGFRLPPSLLRRSLLLPYEPLESALLLSQIPSGVHHLFGRIRGVHRGGGGGFIVYNK